MPAIGHVAKQSNGGFKGQIKTLSIRADIDIVPNTSKSADLQPDFRVLAQGVEIGAAWIRKSEVSGNKYVSLSLAAPEFGPRKLYANLGRAAGQDVGLPGQRHPKAIGHCIYIATKLSDGVNKVCVDKRLENEWPSSKGGQLSFVPRTAGVVAGFRVYKAKAKAA